MARLLNRDFTGAIQDAAKLRQLSPNADSYGVTGLALVQLGNLSQAIQEFELGAQRIPSNRENYDQLAQSLRQVPPNDPIFLQTFQYTLQGYMESFMGGFIDEIIQAYRPFKNQ
jgi:tetratricopeptide (TPR) repeat protein